MKKKILNKFLYWKENSCRFDAFLFIYNYGIKPYLEKQYLNLLRNDKLYLFNNKLINELKINELNFWDYYSIQNKDFLNILLY